MPDLFHSLLKQDVGHLRIIAELWGLELESAKAEGALEELSASLLDPDLLAEIMDSLPPEAVSAITALVNSGGRLPWQTFTRKYGDIREAGAGKRDREKPHLKPSSVTETLYYRGLVARAFFDTEKGPQEFAYLPDDLLTLIKNVGAQDIVPLQETNNEPLGRPASPGERGQELLADDFILDDATTLLAVLRIGMNMDSASIAVAPWRHLSANLLGQAPRLQSLLTSAKLIKKNILQPETVKVFLEASRADALKLLTDAWLESDTFNELKLMPGIVCEGEWANQPLETREFLLNLIDAIPEGKWWSLGAFIRDIKNKYADFQRPASDYDSWFIKRAFDGQYLRGFAHWDQVDGALIRYFITDILHWLGQVDLSIAEGAAEPTAFRLSSFDVTKEEKGRISISSSGKISVPRDVPRVIRYQVSRFCEWDEPKNDIYSYRISTNSLSRAREQGLKAEQLLALLVKHTDNKVPPSLVKALKRWEVNGTEARVETQVVLRVAKPEILEMIRASRAGKFLGEVLSPTAVILKRGAIQKVIEVLAELGLLAEVMSEEK
jgi:hypothetical protein